MVLAFKRFAVKCSRSGLIVRSSVETAYQLGFERQAVCVVFPEKSLSEIGPWTA
jgi:hypothetical protein